MAEAVGIVGSAIAIGELSAKITTACFQYSKAVWHAKEDIERLQKHVAELKELAKCVETLLGSSQDARLRTSQKLAHAVKETELRLDGLNQKLQSSRTQRLMRRLGLRAFQWPFQTNDIDRLLQDLGEYRDTITLALQIDQTSVSSINLVPKLFLSDQRIQIYPVFDSFLSHFKIPDQKRTDFLHWHVAKLLAGWRTLMPRIGDLGFSPGWILRSI